MKTGEKFDMSNDKKILKIKSPKTRLDGPYTVVYKNMDSRWAVVTFLWDNQPRLGFRWFWDSAGMPISRGHSTWLVVPSELTTSILNGFPLDATIRSKIIGFLNGKISGTVKKK